MLERVTAKALPLANRYAEQRPWRQRAATPAEPASRRTCSPPWQVRGSGSPRSQAAWRCGPDAGRLRIEGHADPTVVGSPVFLSVVEALRAHLDVRLARRVHEEDVHGMDVLGGDVVRPLDRDRL